MKMITRTLHRLIPCLLLMFTYSLVNAQYCVPTYVDGVFYGDFIDGVELNTISNLSTGGTVDYTDYSATYSTQLNAGSSYTLTIVNNPDYDEEVEVWIDYNLNNVFDATESLGHVSILMGASGTLTFTVPSTLPSTITKMRVRMAWNEPIIDPCTVYDYGETEDYGIEIIPLPPYCTPDYTVGTFNGTNDGDFLDGVEIGTISNLNSGTQAGPTFNDYTATYSTQLTSGGFYTMTVYNNPTYGENIAAWIDYNQNHVFETSEYVGDVSVLAGASGTISFMVQGGATAAYTTRMRVRLAWGSAVLPMDPCSTYDYGEAEDYTVEILPAPSTDLWTKAFVSPNANNVIPCGNSDVIVTVQNNGSTAIDMSVDPITVNGGVTGAISATFPTATVNTGVLMPGDTLDIVLSNINMTNGGTYSLSASATVTGDGNTSNDAINDDIVIAPTYTVPYLEDFTGQLAPDWLSSGMFLYAVGAHSNTSDLLGGNLYSFNTFIYSISPKIGTIAATNYLLFDYRMVDYSSPNPATTLGAADTFQILVSTDCGNSFTPIYNITAANHTPSTAMTSVALPLTGYAGNTLMFAFAGTWSAGDYWLDIDNVEVRDVFSTDIEVSSIDEPTDGICGSTAQPVTVTIRNLGLNTATNIPITVNVTGATPSTLNAVIPGPLAYGQSTSITIGTINTYTGGTVTLMAMSAQPGDGDATNDMQTLSVSINPIPAAPTLSNATICDGNTASLTASGSGAMGTGYHWFDVNGTEVYQGDTYTTPALSATTTYDVIYSEDVQFSVGKADNTGGGSGYNFYTDGLVFDVFNNITIDSVTVYPGGSGDVTVNVTDALGNPIGSNTVTVNPAVAYDAVRIPVGIAVSPGSNYTIDANGSTVIDLYRNSGSAVFPYTDAGNNVSITDDINGNGPFGYYYFFFDWQITAQGCESPSNSVTVTVNPNPTVSLGNDIAICSGDTTTLTGGGQPTGTTYLWNTTDVTPTLDVTTAGTYTLTVTDGNNCTATDDITVTVNASPVVNLGPDQSVCPNTNVLLTPGTQTAGSTYTWSPAAGNVSTIAVGAGSYSVTVTDANNCSASDDIVITGLTAPTVSLGNDQTLCAGASTTLTSNTQPAGSTYSWSNGNQTASTIVNGSGTVTLTVTNADGCSSSDDVNITVLSQITANATTVQPTCAVGNNGSISLNIVGGLPGYTVSWNTGATGLLLSGIGAGSFTANITDANGCTATSVSTLTFSGAAPVASFTSVIDQATGIATFTNTSTGAGTYTWNFGDGSAASNATNPTHTYATNGSYTVTLTVNNACGTHTFTQEVNITVGIEASLFEGVKVYPNPVQNQLSIAMESVSFENASIVLFDAKGAKAIEKVLGSVHGNMVETLDMSKLSNGIYMLQINDGDRTSFLKVVKQ